MHERSDGGLPSCEKKRRGGGFWSSQLPLERVEGCLEQLAAPKSVANAIWSS